MIIKVWYKNIGDTVPSFISSRRWLQRPDEVFFESNLNSFNESFTYSISWNNQTPSLVLTGDTSNVVNLEENLKAIDSEVEEADKQPFSFNGNLYYPDTEFIQGIFSVLPLLPSNFTEEWKTAEKDTDGVKNKKVTLNKTGIQGLALAYLQFKKDNWKAGELKKEALKEAFLAGE